MWKFDARPARDTKVFAHEPVDQTEQTLESVSIESQRVP